MHSIMYAWSKASRGRSMNVKHSSFVWYIYWYRIQNGNDALLDGVHADEMKWEARKLVEVK